MTRPRAGPLRLRTAVVLGIRWRRAVIGPVPVIIEGIDILQEEDKHVRSHPEQPHDRYNCAQQGLGHSRLPSHTHRNLGFG